MEQPNSNHNPAILNQMDTGHNPEQIPGLEVRRSGIEWKFFVKYFTRRTFTVLGSTTGLLLLLGIKLAIYLLRPETPYTFLQPNELKFTHFNRSSFDKTFKRQYDNRLEPFGNVLATKLEPLDLCSRGSCSSAVEEITRSLNISADPCENFYEYACQGWEANNPRPTYSRDWTVFSKLEKETNDELANILSSTQTAFRSTFKHASNFYQECLRNDARTNSNLKSGTKSQNIPPENLSHLDQANISMQNESYNEDKTTTQKSLGLSGDNKLKSTVTNPDNDHAIYTFMLNILNQHGGWPLLSEPGSWNSSNFNMINLMVAMKKEFASPIFMDIIFVQDPFNRLSNDSFFIRRPSVSLNSVNNFIEQADKTENRTRYALRDFIVNVSKELLIFQGRRYINETYLNNEAWKIIDLSSKLQISEQKIRPEFTLNQVLKMNISELQLLLDKRTTPLSNAFQVNELIFQLYYPFLHENIHKAIKVENMDYLLTITKIVSELRQEVLANYVMFQMITNMIPFSTQAMQKFFSTLQASLEETTGEKPRQQFCTTLVKQKFPLSLRLNYKPYKLDFNLINSLFNKIKQVFHNLVEELEYFNKSRFLAKLQVTKLCLGYSSVTRRQLIMLKLYKELALNQSTFIEKLIAVNTWQMINQLISFANETEMADKCKWTQFSGTVRLFRQPEDFHVYLSLGMLRSPFYYELYSTNRALNYGPLGSMLAHEIARGLFGSGESILENRSLTTYTECLLNQNRNSSTSGLGDKNIISDGLLKLRDDISEQLGLLAAFRVFKNAFPTLTEGPRDLAKFTGEQIFFLGFAQNWCQSKRPEEYLETAKHYKSELSKFHVLRTLRHSKEFAIAWKCPVGSKMNPALSERENCRFS